MPSSELLILTLIFAGALALSLKSGSMPSGFVEVTRADRPRLYWAWAIVLAAITIGTLFAAVQR
jgi:hypothetical protein